MAMKLVIILMLVALSCASKRKQKKHHDAQTDNEDFEPCPKKFDGYCLNGGTCRYVESADDASCICAKNYEGDRCAFAKVKDRFPEYS